MIPEQYFNEEVPALRYICRTVTDNLGTYSYQEWLSKGPNHRRLCEDKALLDMLLSMRNHQYGTYLTTPEQPRKSLWTSIKECLK